jgi:hypothetical protein
VRRQLQYRDGFSPGTSWQTLACITGTGTHSPIVDPNLNLTMAKAWLPAADGSPVTISHRQRLPY